MQYYTVADLHMNHFSVIKYNNRPFKTVEEMNEKLIENWNNVVQKKDFTIIVGDFAWDNHGYFLNRLNGKKILVRGSHDKMPLKHLNCFSEVVDIKTMNYKNRVFVFQHCCPRIWEKSHYGSVAIFGHSHNRLITKNLSFDVGVDVPENNYTPVSMEEILRRVEVREKEMESEGRIKIEKIKGRDVKMYYQDDVAWWSNGEGRNKSIPPNAH